MLKITSPLSTALACRHLFVVVAVALTFCEDAEGQNAQGLRLACDGGSATACYSLGSMYWIGEGAARDRARATRLFQQACDGGEPMSCYVAGFMYDSGRGVPRDLARAATLFQQACDGGYALLACRKLYTGAAPDR